MLQNIRERIQGWFAIVIIVLIAVSFLFFGVEYYLFRLGNNESVIATVDGVKITHKAVDQVLRRVISQREQAGKPALTTEQRKQAQQEALEALIAQAALQQYAKHAGYYASSAQVEQLLMAIPAFQEDGKFSPQKLQRIIYANNTTLAEFMQDMQLNLIDQQINKGILLSAFVTKPELKQIYSLLHQTRNISYAVLSTKQFAKTIKPTEQQIKDYYQQNIDQYKIPAKVEVAYLQLTPEMVTKNVTVSAAEVKQYYEDNISNYQQPTRYHVARLVVKLPANPSAQQLQIAQKKIQAIEKKLKLGAKFNAVMQDKLADTVAVKQWLQQNQVPANVMTILSSLAPGQLSSPFQTAEGYNLIQLLAVQSGKVKTLAQEEKRIKSILHRQKLQRALASQHEDLTDLTYTNPNTLDVAAKKLGLTIQTSPMITQQGLAKGLFSSTEVLNVVFSKDVFENGNNSRPITLKDGSLVVLRIVKKIPEKTKPLSVVRADVVKALIASVAGRQAGLAAFDVQQAIQQDKSVSALSAKYGLKWHTHNAVTLHGNKLPDAISKAVFTMIRTSKQASVTTAVLPDGDYAIIRLYSINLGNFSKAGQKALNELATKLTGLAGTLDYQLTLAAIRAAAKVKIHK